MSRVADRRIYAFYGRLRGRKGGSKAKLSPGAVSSVLSILEEVLRCTRSRGVSVSIATFGVEIGRAPGMVRVLDLSRRAALRRCLIGRLSSLGLKVLVYLCAKVQINRLYTLA